MVGPRREQDVPAGESEEKVNTSQCAVTKGTVHTLTAVFAQQRRRSQSLAAEESALRWTGKWDL